MTKKYWAIKGGRGGGGLVGYQGLLPKSAKKGVGGGLIRGRGDLVGYLRHTNICACKLYLTIQLPDEYYMILITT